MEESKEIEATEELQNENRNGGEEQNVIVARNDKDLKVERVQNGSGDNGEPVPIKSKVNFEKCSCL